MSLQATRQRPLPGPLRRALVPLLTRDPSFLARATGGFVLADDWQRDRVKRIGSAFLRGYNAMATAARPDEVHQALSPLPRYYRPFGYEGAAMGFGPWAWLNGYGYDRFEAVIGALCPATLYQNYVGLGWWLGMWRGRWPGAVAAVAGRLDHRYRLIVYEGLGFRLGFLHAGDPAVTRAFHRFGGDAVHVCHQGYGRSLWFAFMGDLDRASAVVGGLAPAWHGDCYSGIGLGFAYSWLDRAERLGAVLDRIPEPRRADVLQGAAFGWEARQLADRPLFDQHVDPLPTELRERVHASLDLVHQARDELLAEGRTDGFYQWWRRRTRAAVQAAGWADPGR